MSDNYAICLLNSNNKRVGVVYLYSITKNTANMVVILKNISLKYGKLKGFHLHECGDLTNGCASACAHYNPNEEEHGGLETSKRHYGDFGNVSLDSNGNCLLHFIDVPVSLKKCLGRSLVLHEAEDDLGIGEKRFENNPEKINRILLDYLEYSNKKICSKIMGNHALLTEELEKTISDNLTELRKGAPIHVKYSDITNFGTRTDSVINQLIPKIKQFVDSKIIESSKTGNSGARIACGIIGICNKKTIEELMSYL